MARHWITRMRWAFGISQMSLAALCSVSSQTIFRWEHVEDELDPLDRDELYPTNDVLTALYLLWKDKKRWVQTRGVIQLYVSEGRGIFLRELFMLAFPKVKGSR